MPAASADVIYQYTGNPFDTIAGNWAQVFGSAPTNVTVTVDVANPFPAFPIGGSVGGIVPGNLTGVISASISDGVRTFTPDTVFLSGFGTSIQAWLIGGGIPAVQFTSNQREITTQNTGNPSLATGDFDEFVGFDANNNPFFDTASASSTGQWTAVVTPETNTGGLALVSVTLLLVGYWRKRGRTRWNRDM